MRSGQKPESARRRPPRAWHLCCAGILFLTFAAYLPCLNNGFTNWDDPLFVLRNPLLLNPNVVDVVTTPVANNYHPVTIWSLALNYKISGLDPRSYHWLNLLLHLANTGLVFLFVRRLSRDRFWTTVVTSLFFGIHPMHVESVAWIAERKDVAYTFFYLLGLIAYLRYLDRMKWAWLGGTLLAFALSVASKPSAVVLPLTLLAIDFYRRRPIRVRVFLEKVPFFAISLAAGILTIHAQEVTGAIDTQHWGPSLQKVVFACHGITMYAVKLFWPVHLSAIYPYPGPAEGLGWQFYLAFGLVAIGLPAILYLCRRNRPVLFGIAFFFVNIALVLQVFTVGQAIMADRYTYLPYVGLFLALAWWLDEGPAAGSAGRAWRTLLAGTFLFLAPFSVVQTWKRCEVWKNSETLWNDTITKYPHRIVYAYYNRGYYYYQDARRFDAALADFDRAIAIDPKAANVWLIKGNLLADLGRTDSAMVCFDHALRLRADLDLAWSNRSAVKLRMGDVSGALSDAERAIALNPILREAHCNLALTYARMGEYEKSIAASRRAIALDPRHPDNYAQYASIGVALEGMKRYAEAITALDEAIRLVPHRDSKVGSYYLFRSYAKLALGDRTGALQDANEALRLGATVEPAYITRIGG
jgi:tetratricopeptide (TPR) repeat protein